MFKDGWCVRLGQERVAWGWGNYLKYLTRGWNRKEERGNKDFKKVRGRGQAGSKCGCLKKKRGAGTPLRTMFLYRVFRRFDKDLCNFFCEMCKVSIFRDLFKFCIYVDSNQTTLDLSFSALPLGHCPLI